MNELLNTGMPAPVIKGRDIVMISLAQWDTKIGSNSRNLAIHLAKNNRVLYVNYPITRKTYLMNKEDTETKIHRDIIREKKDPLKKVDENLWVYYPTTLIESAKWLPLTSLFKAVTYINNKRYAKDIKKAIKELDFKDITIFNDNDIYNGFYLKELLKPAMDIYYFKDFLQGFNYWKKHASVMEPQLIKKMDAIVTNSTYYNEYCSTLTKKSFYIGQGCNLAVFHKNKEYKTPEDMKGIAGPIIGYVGVLDKERLNEKIIEIIAQANPKWNVVLVGPSDEFFKQSSLHQIPNIHFLGWKSLEQLPGYMESFDVCMNPQWINNITRGNYPLKIDEYLALGKPVVATRTKAMELFEAYSYLADTPEEYPALIEKALAENSQEKEEQRIAFANTHTWENCVSDIYKVMDRHFKNQL